MLLSRWLRLLSMRMQIACRDNSRVRRVRLIRPALSFRSPSRPFAEVLEDRTLLSGVSMNLSPPDGPIEEGSEATIRGTIESESPVSSITLLIDWGDGSQVETHFGSPGDDFFFYTHVYPDDDPTATPFDTYTVNLALQTDLGNAAGQVEIVVANVAPTLSEFQVPDLGEPGAEVTFSVTATDPGPNDILRTIWTIEQPDQSLLTFAGESIQFTPAMVGPHTVTAIASDDDTGIARNTATFLVGDTFILMPSDDLLISDEAIGGKVDALSIQFDDATDEVVIKDPTAFFINTIGTRVSDHEVRVPTNAIAGQIVVNTGEGNDALQLDYSRGLPATGNMLIYDGGADDDRLDLIGATVGVLTHTMTNASSGSIDLDGRQVDYVGLEPIGDNLLATHRVFHFAETDDVITVGDDGVIGNGISRISSVSSSETIDFVNPTGSLTVNAGRGNDTVTLDNMDAQFSTAIPFVVNGEDGNDRLTGSIRADSLNGGAGDDTLNGGLGDDVLDGQSGNDTLFGGAGKDSLTGGDGDDRLKGQGSTDTIIEISDTNFILTNTTLIGRGTDSLPDSNRVLLLGGDSANTIDARAYSLGSVTIRGGAGDDILHGGRRADVVDGGIGNDLVNGAQGNDRLMGGVGDDSLYGGSGKDTLTGGEGNDDLRGQGSSDTIREIANTDFALSDNAMTGVGSDILSGIEHAYLTGGDGHNLIDARGFTRGGVTLDGGAGNDSIHGGRLDDVVFGNDGDDLVNGFHGDDSVIGGDGDDFLFGGAGRDALVGQAGRDYVKGQGSTDTLAGGSGLGADPGDSLIGSANEIDETFTLDFQSLLI